MSLSGKANSGNTLTGKLGMPETIHGKSAYEMAVEYGYTGTFEDWIESVASGRLTDGHREAIADLVVEKNRLAIELEKNARIEADNFILESLGLGEVSKTAYEDYCLSAVNRINETLGFVQPEYKDCVFGERHYVTVTLENGKEKYDFPGVYDDEESHTFTYDLTSYKGCKLVCRSKSAWADNTKAYGYALYNESYDEILAAGVAFTVEGGQGYNFVLEIPSNAGKFLISCPFDYEITFDVESVFDISKNVNALMKMVPAVDNTVTEGSTNPVSGDAVYEYGEEIKAKIPTVDGIVTYGSGNPVSSAAVSKYMTVFQEGLHSYVDSKIGDIEFTEMQEQIEGVEKVYTSADFMQGFRQVGTGLITDGNESLYRIVNTNMPKVTAGDKVYVTPAEGFSVDVAVTDTDDYANVTSYLQHIPHNAASYECEIIYDGYLNIDVMSTVGVKVSPSDYACDIRVVSKGIKERLSNVENSLEVVAESTEANTENINTLTEQLQNVIPEKNFTSADFVQGWRQLGVGFEEVTTYITNAKLLKVKAGNKITINPNGYKLWISVADTDDYSVTGKIYSLNKINITEYFEYTFEDDGYLNINVNNFGNRIEPGNYTCDISVIFDNTDERLSEVEYNLKSAETLSSKSKLFTTIVNDCQDMSQWKSSSGSVVADNDCIMWNQSLRCNGEMRCTANTYDLLNNDLVFKIRINSIENGSSIVLRLGNTSNSSVGATYELMRGADTTPTGEWREITVPYSVYKQQSSGVDFGAVNDIHIYADNLSTSGVDGVADWNIQYIGTRPRKLNKGIVSFTFDDGYKTQYTGVKLLAEKGITSTIYHIAEATGQGEILSTEELQELVNYYGADIEVHGDIPVNAEGENGYNALSDEELIEHWSYSQKFLKENGLSEGRHMSYPGNYHNNRVVQLAKKFFDSCRTIQYYIPCETYPPADHYRLRAVSSVGASGNNVETIKNYIDRAMASGSWLILTFHRIGDVQGDSMYCSESDLQAIADYAIESGAMIKNIAEVYNTPSTSVGAIPSSESLENVIVTAYDFEGKEEQLTDDVVPSMALFYNAFVGHEERLLSLEEDYTQALELLGGAE